jgi:hypothetical protein
VHAQRRQALSVTRGWRGTKALSAIEAIGARGMQVRLTKSIFEPVILAGSS